MADFPVIINARDRLSCLQELVEWLHLAGHERITILDNDSTYPPMVEWLHSHHGCEVNFLGENIGHKALWSVGVPDEFFVLTDPDVIPDRWCPLDLVEYLGEVLDAFPDHRKAGPGLIVDDIPDHYAHKAQVIEWEKQFWGDTIEGPRKKLVRDAWLDTTFALWRPGAEYDIKDSIRTDAPYLARHISWYMNSENPTEEERYYAEHARSDITSWSQEKVPERYEVQGGLKVEQNGTQLSTIVP